jgi:hypothetical protein
MSEFPTSRNLRSAGDELLTHLMRAIPPIRVVARLERLLDAQIRTKHGDLLDDGRTQLAACQLLAAYYAGKPVERVEQLSVNADTMTGGEMVERLRASPALREQLRSFLAEADARDTIEAKGRLLG